MGRHISISYKSEIGDVPQFPECKLFFNSLKAPAVLSRPGAVTLEVPEVPNRADRILFRISFKKGDIVAIARVKRPFHAIHLRLTAPNRVLGTIQGAHAVGADVVYEGCDVGCLPPAEEEPLSSHCVLCTDADGEFELCC